MFEPRWLDRLSRVHVAIVPALFLPAIVTVFALAFQRMQFGAIALWAVVGYVVWTLTEYWMHRVIFHFEPDHGIGARLHWIIHGVHHDHPNDPKRLVMPPSVSVPLASLFVIGFYLAVGGPRFLAIGGGFLAGYLAYDMLHYHVHHHTPKTRLGHWLRTSHMRHHFQDETRGFGISAPWLDFVFRTVPTTRREGE